MAIRVFISHSTKETNDKPFLDDLCQRLSQVEKNGQRVFDVIVDAEELKAGENWRAKLLQSLGNCQAGVVLLNTKAISKSDWVHQETSILLWRKWLGEKVALVPLLIGAGSKKAFDGAGRWRPLALAELQFLGQGKEFSDAVLDDAAFTELSTELQENAGAAVETNFEKLQAGVRAQLHNAFAGSDVSDRIINRETDRLLADGPMRLLGFIDDYRTVLDSEYVENVLEVIAPWWVDPASSCRLANAAGQTATAAFSINGNRLDYLPVMYVRHACCGTPDFAWKVVKVTGTAGTQDREAFKNAIVAETRAGLKEAYRRVWKERTPTVSDDEINDLIASRRRRGRPTFVALNTNIAASKELAEAILAAFSGVTLLLMAATPHEARAIAHSEPLEPLPDPQEVVNEYNNYRDALGELP